MIASAIVTVVSTALAIMWRSNLRRVVALAVLVRILVPPQAVGVDFVKIHPSWLVVAAASAVFILCETPRFRRAMSATWPLGVLMILLFSYGMLNSVVAYAKISVAIGVLLQIVVLPYMIMLILWAECRSPGALRPIAWVMIAGAIGEVALGQLQLNEQRAIFWEAEYATSWFWTDKVERALGTTGHGLQLGILCALAVPFLRYVRWVPLRVACIPILIYGTIIGSARTALVIAVVLAALVLAQSFKDSPVSATLSAVLVIPIGVLVISAQSAIVTDMVDKLSGQDGPSTQLRVDAAAWFSEHYRSFLIMGSPMNGDLRTDGYLKSSLENGYFMVSLLFGVLFTVLFAVFAGLALLGGARRVPRTYLLSLAGVACLVSFASNGSFMSGSVDGIVFWVIEGAALGLASKDLTARRVASPQGVVDRSASSLPKWRLVTRGMV